MSHTKTNYKSKYGITLKEAKAIVKGLNGRLPRPGYEALIMREVLDNYHAEFWLQNSAGSFSIRRWINVSSFSHLQK